MHGTLIEELILFKKNEIDSLLILINFALPR
jgi:hypothetical protein